MGKQEQLPVLWCTAALSGVSRCTANGALWLFCSEKNEQHRALQVKMLSNYQFPRKSLFQGVETSQQRAQERARGNFAKKNPSSEMEIRAVDLLLPFLPPPPQLPASSGRVFRQQKGLSQRGSDGTDGGTRHSNDEVVNRSPAGSSNAAWRQQPSARLAWNPTGTTDVGARLQERDHHRCPELPQLWAPTWPGKIGQLICHQQQQGCGQAVGWISNVGTLVTQQHRDV